MKADNIPIANSLLQLMEKEPFVTARECGDTLDITPQKASGVLRSMESEGMIKSKKVHAGMNDLKCYFISKKVGICNDTV